MNTYDANVDVIMTPIPACGRVPGPKKGRGTPMGKRQLKSDRAFWIGCSWGPAQ